jgi:hypothetical protein
MHSSDQSDKDPATPWGGYNSLEAQVDALRRARFWIGHTFELTGRGLVAQGTILEGSISAGMVLLPVLEDYPNICTPVPILGVEAIDSTGGGDVGLVLGNVIHATGGARVELSPGTVIDVLESTPAT